MDINWFTVIAQVINFLILVWLLKKFLYKPILNAVNEREKRITDELKDADAQKSAAQKEKDHFKKKITDFDSEKKKLMEKAVADANKEKKLLIDTAKADANALGSTMEKAFREQQEQNKKEFVQNTKEQIFAITRKVLTDIASVSLEDQSTDTFIKHLKAVKGEEKQQFVEAFKASSNVILVRSSFNLPLKQQDELTNAVNELLSTKTELQFKTAPKLINGIELSTNGYKMAWSFSEYLSALQKYISVEIKDNIAPQPEKKEHAST